MGRAGRKAHRKVVRASADKKQRGYRDASAACCHGLQACRKSCQNRLRCQKRFRKGALSRKISGGTTDMQGHMPSHRSHGDVK